MKLHAKMITWAVLVTGAFLIAYCTTPPQPASQHYSAEDTLVLSVNKPGIYRLSLKELEWNNVPIGNVQLSHKGTVMPIHWVDKDTIEFLAPPEKNKYTNKSYFILRKGEKSPLINQLQSTPPMEWGNFILETTLIHENKIYQPTVKNNDHWLMDRLLAPGSVNYEFTLSNVYSDAVGKLYIALWSSTETPQDMDHTVQIFVNNQYIDQYSWDGITWISTTLDLPTKLLYNGNNQIRIQSSNKKDNISIIYIDSLTLKIPVEFSLSDDQLIYETQNNVANASKITTYLFNPQNPYADQYYIQDSYVPHKQGYINISTFGDTSYSVENIHPYNNSKNLKLEQNAFDYVLLADKDLHESLDQLLAMRNSQGLSSILLDPQSIYDQFGYGYPEPDAIKSFLIYAVQHWNMPPKYVLLVGDYTYDPKGFQYPVPQYTIPSYFIQTVYGGETLSDVPYVIPDNQAVPEIAIGRIPASTPAEVQIFVNKIIAYETNPITAKYIYTTSDPSDKQFYTDAQQIMTHLGKNAKYIDPYQIKASGFMALNDDTRALFYFGHGSIDTWGKDKILYADHDFSSGPPIPLIVNMTCLTGYFYHPEITSLAESLLFAPQGGAIAVIAPSSLTLPSDQSYISTALAQNLSAGNTIRVGDMILDAWKNTPDSTSSAKDVLLTFMLFGDPAMNILKETNQ